MSLVEKATQRLEELRRAGSLVAGELSAAAHEAGEEASSPAPGTIERIVAQMEGRRSAARPHGVATGAGTQDAVHEQEPAASRREPHIGTLTQAAQEPRARSGPAELTIDFAMLGARGYLTPDDSESALANQFRKVKWPLVQACQGRSAPRVNNANRIMVSSSVPGEGKSFIALNLALSIAAERDLSVLLVDADTTRPSVSQLLGISTRLGLLDVLSGKALPESVILSTNVEKLSVLGAGARRNHATELLASDAMERLVAQLANEVPDRILVFDAPPLLAAPEPAALATYMGQIVLVVEADRTTHATIRNALAAVETCPVVRMVLNKANSNNERYSYAG